MPQPPLLSSCDYSTPRDQEFTGSSTGWGAVWFKQWDRKHTGKCQRKWAFIRKKPSHIHNWKHFFLEITSKSQHLHILQQVTHSGHWVNFFVYKFHQSVIYLFLNLVALLHVHSSLITDLPWIVGLMPRKFYFLTANDTTPLLIDFHRYRVCAVC